MNLLDTASILGLKILKFATVSLASVMVVGSSYMAWDMHHAEKAAFSSYDLSQYRPQVENGEPATLEDVEEINPDSRAWITIYGTHIDYPVTQGRDDLEYVNKDIYGKTSPTGSIYLTSQNNSDFSDPYNLMYGHHMDNGAMFGDVDAFQDAGFFNSHTKGILVTKDQVYDLELFGAVEDYAYNKTIYNPKRTGLAITDFVAANAVQKRNVGNISKVLALSTCDYGRTNGRDLAFFKVTPHEGDYHTYIPDERPPLVGHGDDYWALLNLLCMIVTCYSFLPLHALFSKYRRKPAMKARKSVLEGETGEAKPISLGDKMSAWIKDNGLDDPLGRKDEDPTLPFDTKRFGRKTSFGTLAELLIALGSVIAFILTEDMRLPIRIIDEWTPLMLLLLFLAWLADVRLLRLSADEEEGEEEQEPLIE